MEIDMVKSFPTDYMHSVCLGTVIKILFLWRDCRRQFGISKVNLDNTNKSMYNISKHWPSDFERKLRP